MGITTRTLRQRAVYWPPAGNDRHGRATFGTAVHAKVRWTVKQELFLASNGKEEVSKAMVLIDVEPALDGVLWLGDKANLTAEQLADPLGVLTDCFPIRAIGSVRGVRKNIYLRKAIL